ncbi:hypothetical protein LCGC14_1465260 [marine sediment metagenome]|uniref:IrrE N-terminal-like domain-containing protein n=1 Tax=marine sediment metagenome TaxID=412755 RepID=A0A0F9JEH5_9ZZZZ
MIQKSEAFINPNLLKWAREQCRFTHEEAVQSRFSPVKLRKAERGEENLTFKQFIFIANRYKRSPAFFYLKQHPDEELIQDFRKTNHEKKALSPVLREQIINIKEKREIAVEFKNFDKEFQYKYINSITLEQNTEDIAEKIISLLKLHVELRKKWKDKYKAFNSLRKAFEDVGILVFQVSRIDIKEMRGFSFSEEPYPTIALNRSDSPFGRIFTLIHELCHIMLNKGGLCTLKSEDEIHFEIEKFCNAVAGAVLVPQTFLLNHELVLNHANNKTWELEELDKLKKIFWCSSEVILRRLLIFEKTSAAFYQEMRKYWQSLPKPSGGGPEKSFEKVLRTNPKTYIKILLNALYERKITMTDISSYLNIKLKYLKSLERKLEG